MWSSMDLADLTLRRAALAAAFRYPGAPSSPTWMPSSGSLGWLAVFATLFGLGGWLLKGPGWSVLLLAGLSSTLWLLFRQGSEEQV